MSEAVHAERLIARVASGDPVDGMRALHELLALGAAGERALFARPFQYPRTLQATRRWLTYVASRQNTIVEPLLERMSDGTPFTDRYAISLLFAGLPEHRAITDTLYTQISAFFKDGEPVSSDYSPTTDRMIAWGYAGGSAATLWHWVKDSGYAWEKMATFAFRGACRSFARIAGPAQWALEQFVTHEWDAEALVEKVRQIENDPDVYISHRAIDNAEIALQANDPFVMWRRGEVADVILRDWTTHRHWRVRYIGAQILASFGFRRTLSPVAAWLAAEPSAKVRAPLLHALEAAGTGSAADVILDHFEATREGVRTVARVAWKAHDRQRAERALLEVIAGSGQPAEAVVSLARLNVRPDDLEERLNSGDHYVRLNAVLAFAYLGDKRAVPQLDRMRREAATTLERIAITAAAALLGAPQGATALHDVLVTAASMPDFDKRVDIVRLHPYLQQAVFDAFEACGDVGAELARVWRDECEALAPVTAPLPGGGAPQPMETTSVTSPRANTSSPAVAVESRPLRVFVSYSHNDEKMRVRLEQHLAPLVDDRLIHIWQDREIEAGADWEQEINREIPEADIVLLLVSATFLKSPYCRNELQRAIALRSEGKSLPIPIILRPCDWEAVFNRPEYKLQALPRDNRSVAGGRWANQDAAYTAIAKELRRLVERMRA